MSVIEKYLKIHRERLEAGLPIGDVCEHCNSQARNKYNMCDQCGAPMKPLLGFVFGIPIEQDDFTEVQESINGMQYLGTATMLRDK